MTARVRTGCRWVLGVVFLVAGGAKIAHPAGFFSDLLGFRVPLPEIILRLVAVALPWLEAIAGLGLLLNFWRETIRPLVALLYLVFVVMLGQAVIRGLDLNCGCFGSSGQGWFERPDVALGRAVLLFAAALYVAAERREN
jgi:hypothetical protein